MVTCLGDWSLVVMALRTDTGASLNSKMPKCSDVGYESRISRHVESLKT